jgi:c-di-GMP-binding flagellar brake protein YcgR
VQSDRRRFLRVEARLSVVLRGFHGDGERGPEIAAQTVNVSAGGALVQPAHALQPANRAWLELHFERPGFLVACDAEVVRLAADGEAAAVRFVDLGEDVEQRIVRWVYAEDRRVFDRRAQARIPVRLRARCRTADGDEFSAPTLDVAADGARLLTDRVLADGAALEMVLDLDDRGRPVSTAATVVWSRPQADGRVAYGVRFAPMTAAVRREFVERAFAVERTQHQ